MPTITPYLWFNNNLEEALLFYKTVFPDMTTANVQHYGEAGPGPAGSIMMAEFTINGQNFTGLNGGPEFAFTEAISFLISCQRQSEVDELWDKLTSNSGQPGRCGWLKDKFGLSWQIVPQKLGELLSGPDPAASGRVMQAMMQMNKIDSALLQQAYDQV